MRKKRGLIIFDLDGVLINSEQNMSYAWSQTCKNLKIKISFNEYKKFVGLGFFEILNKLNVKKKYHKDAFTQYNFYSKKKINRIKLFRDVKKVLSKIRYKYKIALFTSKNKSRVKKIISNLNLSFSKIITLEDVRKPKPSPEGLKKIINSYNFKKKEIFFIGDTFHDFQAAKLAKINYIQCNWGFKQIRNKNIIVINKITDLINILEI